MSYSPTGFGTVNMHTKVFLNWLKNNYSLFNWTKKKDLKIVDIGTGPGTTLLHLIPLIPQDYSEIISTDIDQEMMSHFSSLPKDPRISIRKLDIQSRNIPHDLKNRFDLALSTNVFMYLDNHRCAFKNSSMMLKTGGELFFGWGKRCDLHDCYKALAQTAKWNRYTSDFKDWNTYFDTEDPIGAIEIELNYAGCEPLHIEEMSNNVFGAENEQFFLDIYDSLDFISKRIPKCDLPNYKKDFYALIKARLLWDSRSEFGCQVKHPFPILLVAARKK